jgi:hypothetical protein
METDCKHVKTIKYPKYETGICETKVCTECGVKFYRPITQKLFVKTYTRNQADSRD